MEEKSCKIMLKRTGSELELESDGSLGLLIRLVQTDCELEILTDGSLRIFIPGEFSGPFPSGAQNVGNGVFFTTEDSRQLQGLLHLAKKFLEENQ